MLDDCTTVLARNKVFFNNKRIKMQSEKIDQLAKALSSFQKSLPSIPKNKTAGKGAFSYKYADLDDSMKAIKELLFANKLSISQPLEYIDGELYVKTIVMHESGQFITSLCPCTINQADKMTPMQKKGTAISYARRYSLSILGLTTDEDTDNQGPEQVKQNNQQQKNEQPQWTLEKLYYSTKKMCDDNMQAANDIFAKLGITKNKQYTEQELKKFFFEIKGMVNS